MKRIVFTIASMLVVGPATVLAQDGISEKGDAILGAWINAPGDAKFEIYKRNDAYFGKITWGTRGAAKDVKNPDPRLRDRDLVGLTILNSFVFEGENTWGDGTIYDPNDGKTYSCKLTLTSAAKLDVRGFVGLSLFGRTETWTKINP